MTEKAAIRIEDVERLAEVVAPDLLATIEALLNQPVDTEETEDQARITLATLKAQLEQASKRSDKAERRAHAQDAWKRYLAQEQVAPQMKLAELIEKLYERKTGPARLALLELARNAPLLFGIWGGLKRVYKRAEREQDAEVFGVLGARFDHEVSAYGGKPRDVKRGTLIYLQRRVWRFLRLLGKATPEIYPQFVVEVARNYPHDMQEYNATVFNHVKVSWSKKWGMPQGLPKEKKFRPAYREAWERSPDPLMLLLETTRSDFTANFAITGLRELFPEALRSLSPAFLARLAFRKLASAHDFLVETLAGSPDFHQGKLKSLGLHDAVVALLASPSKKAREYAIEYARGHASDLPVDMLLDFLANEQWYVDTAKFVATLLEGRGARKLGVEVVAKLLAFNATRKWATAALGSEFDAKELSDTLLVDNLLSESQQRSEWARSVIDKSAANRPLTFWMRILGDAPLKNSGTAAWVIQSLMKHIPIRQMPGDWVLSSLDRNDIAGSMMKWLQKAEALPEGIDIERIKGLVFDSRYRNIAFILLGNKKLVSPSAIGLGWLLALARRADPQLHDWAHRYLLEHMRPEHFAEGKTDGITRLFALAFGSKEPEAVRAFAHTFLRCHHPVIGRDQPESKQFNVKPAIAREAYTFDRVWPALFDQRADVRRFAVAITRVELRRWNAQSRVYELADANAKEVRKIAYDALSQAGQPDADKDLALLPEELDAAQIFSMTESRVRASRDIAIELIRRHYKRIGGAERLGWLMQSADREVRFFAVRLLWEKHRPRGLPTDWKPPKGRSIANAGPFEDAEALRKLLRRLLFTIPPGRSMEALEGARTKKQPTGVAKRSLVEIVRDLAVEDATFAQLVAPVFAEQTGSKAKGEWQACLSALMTLRGAHGIAFEELV